MAQCKAFLLTIFVLATKNEAARILAVFPIPSISHQVVFRPLTLELAKRGHEVIVVTPDPIFKDGKSPANFTEIDVHDLSYEAWRSNILSEKFASGSKDDLPNQLFVAFTMMNNVFEKQLKTPEVQKLIRTESNKFDLLILEACVSVALGLTHVFKVPVIQISSFGTFISDIGTIGMPMHPILHSSALRQRVYNLSEWEKIVAIYDYLRLENVVANYEKEGYVMLKRVLGRDLPPLSVLRNNVDMLFLNVHPIWELNRPSPPNVIYMGGLHQNPVKDLPQDLKSYLDSSKHGVIYISFGTNVDPSNLPSEKIQIFINVFSKLPYDILWKWNKDELPGQTKNIRISKWLPQSDLLRHPKLKLFITQGGLQSTDEAITAGVPMIGIPMLGDQWYNVELYVYHKIGLRLDMDTITEESLENAISTIVKDSTYRKNVENLRSIMRDQPQSPLERAVWWTEYVIRHSGARHLRAPGANMPWYQYYELELVTYLLLGVLAVLLSVVGVCYYVFKIFKRNRTTIKIKNN